MMTSLKGDVYGMKDLRQDDERHGMCSVLVVGGGGRRSRWGETRLGVRNSDGQERGIGERSGWEGSLNLD
jgi:hypothetical protein